MRKSLPHPDEQRMNGGAGTALSSTRWHSSEYDARVNELAKNHSTIYPIASRCGVFAKSDVNLTE